VILSSQLQFLLFPVSKSISLSLVLVNVNVIYQVPAYSALRLMSPTLDPHALTPTTNHDVNGRSKIFVRWWGWVLS